MRTTLDLNSRAGQPADPATMVNLPQLMTAYARHPDPGVLKERVAFVTSGHRVRSLSVVKSAT